MHKEIYCCKPAYLNVVLTQQYSVLNTQTVMYLKHNRNISISWHKWKSREQRFSCCKLTSAAAGQPGCHPHCPWVSHTMMPDPFCLSSGLLDPLTPPCTQVNSVQPGKQAVQIFLSYKLCVQFCQNQLPIYKRSKKKKKGGWVRQTVLIIVGDWFFPMNTAPAECCIESRWCVVQTSSDLQVERGLHRWEHLVCRCFVLWC